jgi:type VI secretion system secreted protein VgrG
MTLSQTNRLIRIATPLGNDAFIVASFSGTEEISELFEFELQLVSKQNNITFGQLAGKNVTVAIRSSDGSERFFNGIITAFTPMQVAARDNLSRYHAVMTPSVWLLTQCMDCRIFQNKSAPDIIKEVLGLSALGQKGIVQPIDFRLKLSGAYQPRELCVQFNETDFDFISRLCETEGIFYFFEHENGRHTLIFADSPDTHKPHLAGEKQTVPFQATLGGVLDREVIISLRVDNRLTTSRYTARDYNFIRPQNDTTVQRAARQAQPKTQGELYEYPGGYTKVSGHGVPLAQVRMQAEEALALTLKGQSNCRGFAPGYTFKLADFPLTQANGKTYVFIKVRHEAKQAFTNNNGGEDAYNNFFFCLPGQTPFRPRRKTVKPMIASSQTAIVTGPEAEEIHTDKYGRVKVKFHWDRRTDKHKDGNMSCWIRVAQNQAGAGWGALHIPRVGQEVIVNFVDGDPDRPIITGCVYHGMNLPPYDLPVDRTKTTLKSDSTKNGGGGFNEICFEDLTGHEDFFTHAAKDRNEVVENDKSTQVKGNQLIKVEKSRAVTVASGNEIVTVQSGMRHVSVQSNEQHANAADFCHKISGDYTLKVSGNITINAGGLVTINGAKIILNG